jgi:PPOX class probable F420-dependent enzyme
VNHSVADRVGRAPTETELAFVRARRVGRLATVGADNLPAVVPVCYALIDGATGPKIVSVLDEKPKRVPDAALGRVRRIRERPAVALVVDDYSDDWRRLAWVQVRGQARLIEPEMDGHQAAIEALRAKYPHYLAMAIR